MNAKEWKGIEAQGETSYPDPGNWRAHREGRTEEEKERNRARDPNQTTLDPSIASYDPQGSHSEPILLTPHSPVNVYIYIYYIYIYIYIYVMLCYFRGFTSNVDPYA